MGESVASTMIDLTGLLFNSSDGRAHHLATSRARGARRFRIAFSFFSFSSADRVDGAAVGRRWPPAVQAAELHANVAAARADCRPGFIFVFGGAGVIGRPLRVGADCELPAS